VLAACFSTEDDAVTWDPIWEQLFSSRAWGRYPGEDLIRFVMRSFSSVAVADRSAVRILEVGSGTGANLWFLAREGFATYGVEGSRTAAAICARRLDEECPAGRRRSGGGELITGDISSLPWPDGHFDALIDCEAVYCNDLENSRAIYREMFRTARSGGRLFVRTFATGSWGDGLGQRLEPGRFIADEGPLEGKGASRFTAYEQIPELLSPWQIVEVNLITRTLDAQRHSVREWIIEGHKL
jgi:SAM-dependent methyltransferase